MEMLSPVHNCLQDDRREKWHPNTSTLDPTPHYSEINMILQRHRGGMTQVTFKPRFGEVAKADQNLFKEVMSEAPLSFLKVWGELTTRPTPRITKKRPLQCEYNQCREGWEKQRRLHVHHSRTNFAWLYFPVGVVFCCSGIQSLV
jgi:hypothetical protein